MASTADSAPATRTSWFTVAARLPFTAAAAPAHWGHYGSECATATLNPELCRGSNNTAEIQNRVGQQTLNFASGGYLHVEGGGAGDQNWAGIENDGGDQIIAGLPDIMLKGGTGGRILVYGGDVFDFYNDAGIYNESNGDQIIYGGQHHHQRLWRFRQLWRRRLQQREQRCVDPDLHRRDRRPGNAGRRQQRRFEL
jgi:hypothetical protein